MTYRLISLANFGRTLRALRSRAANIREQLTSG
jgi:hypothetical protein